MPRILSPTFIGRKKKKFQTMERFFDLVPLVLVIWGLFGNGVI